MIEWKYAICSPSGVASLAESYEDAENAVETLVNEYGINRDELEIVEYEGLFE